MDGEYVGGNEGTVVSVTLVLDVCVSKSQWIFSVSEGIREWLCL